MPAGQIADFFHIVTDNARHFEIIGIGCFPSLKIDIGILGRPSNFRPLRIGAAGTEFCHCVKIGQLGHIVVIDDGDFLDFV